MKGFKEILQHANSIISKSSITQQLEEFEIRKNSHICCSVVRIEKLQEKTHQYFIVKPKKGFIWIWNRY